MTIEHTPNEVWRAIDDEDFAVLGMVNARGEARTVGICYVIDGHKMYIGAELSAWKTRHISANRHVSVTIPIARRVPLLPWIKVPAATITFSGTGRVVDREEMTPDLVEKLYRHDESSAEWRAIEVTPASDFVTYGLGVSVLQMRYPDRARGRAPRGASTASGR